MTNHIQEKKHAANYDGFSLANGGLFYALTAVFRGKSGTTAGLIRTAIALALITWLPVCVLAILAGTLQDNPSTISFFEDFLVHTRYLFVVPFLIIIEHMVDRTFVAYVQNTDRIIPNSQQAAYNRMVERLNQLSNSYVPEILFLVVMYGMIIFGWDSLPVFESDRNYVIKPDSKDLTAAGWYNLLVSAPIFRLLIFRWLWRWIIWVYSIVRISRFKLHTDPLHADQMAGLSYLNLSPVTFSFILMAPSAGIAATIGIDIIYHDMTYKDYVFPILLYVSIIPSLLYAPLLLFIPFMIRAKSYGVLEFGHTIRKHNNDYEDKWINREPLNGEPILGAVDHSSLADINGSYDPILGMKLIPIDLRMLLLSIGLVVVPLVPLVFTYYSPIELFKMLVTSVLGG